MSRDPVLFLEDLLEAAGKIDEFIEGMTEAQFCKDLKTIHACMSCFQIVGEAVKKLPVSWKESEPTVPWHEIQGFRNALVHEYFHIDERIMWATIQDDLKPLRAACQRIQEQLDNKSE